MARLVKHGPVRGMAASAQHQCLAADRCVHIYTVSAAMIGVCLTGVGLLRVVISLKRTNTLADDFSAWMQCCSCSPPSAYWTLRWRGVRQLERLEFLADITFVAGMVLMAGICIFITYAIAT